MLALLLASALAVPKCSTLIGQAVSTHREAGFDVTMTVYPDGAIVLMSKGTAHKVLILSPKAVPGRSAMWEDLGQCARDGGQTSYVYGGAFILKSPT